MRGMALESRAVFAALSDSSGKDVISLVGSGGASMRDCHSDSKFI
jgi:hypothetical protein